jgi:RNA polymerase sigma-70 factor (ECF subfamily)
MEEGMPRAVTDVEASAEPDAEFVELFTKHQRRLFLLILSQMHDPIESEEILQNVNVVVWKKCRQFQAGTNFLAWAGAIANFEILKHRSRRTRDKLVFSEEFLATVAAETLERSEELELRRAALKDCIQKLRPQDRELIEQRYAPGETGKNLAELIGRPANSVYQSLGRIRRTLLECIQRRLTADLR